MSEVYAVFEGYHEMLYGYPPNLHGLFTTRELAEEAAQAWQEQAVREKAEATDPAYLHSTFEPLYVVPIPVQVEVGPMPPPGNVGLGLTEWKELHDQGKV